MSCEQGFHREEDLDENSNNEDFTLPDAETKR